MLADGRPKDPEAHQNPLVELPGRIAVDVIRRLRLKAEVCLHLLVVDRDEVRLESSSGGQQLELVGVVPVDDPLAARGKRLRVGDEFKANGRRAGATGCVVVLLDHGGACDRLPGSD